MKKKRTKRIMFLFIVTLLLLLLVKCSKNFNTSNPISHEINKTINDSKKSIEETEPTGEGSKDEEAKKATESNKSNTKSENKSNSSSTSNKNNSSSNTGSSNKPSSGSNNKNSSSNKNNGSNSSSSSNSNKGGSSSSNNKPSHAHNWVNVTKTVNHPAKTHQEDVYENRQVKVKDAWDEKVYVKTVKTCRQCGFSTSNPSEMTNHMLENGHSCSSQDIYKTVHHDAVYETKRVKTGTKTVVDKPAWTETVVTGKKCTSCGATKKE